MPVLFGGKSCVSPESARASAQWNNFPLTPWHGRANSFVCPLGFEPGRGTLLMLRQDITSLGLARVNDLVFHQHQQRITIKNLLILHAYAVLPGMRDDPKTLHWVEVVDQRYLARQTVIDKAYNLRSTTASATYFSATLNSGSPWTWAEMIGDVWAVVGTALVGTFPGLPFVPHGTPEEFDFYGGNAWQALEIVLHRIGCTVKYNPLEYTYAIVQISADDPATTTALDKHDAERRWDDYPYEGRIPSTCRVQFRKRRAIPNTTGASEWYISDQSDTVAAGAGGPVSTSDNGASVIVYDDLIAQVDSAGSVTNTSVLTARAQERAADFFRQIRTGRLHRRFTGLPDEPGLLPAAQIKVTVWTEGEAEQGLTTLVSRFPGLPINLASATTRGAFEGGGRGRREDWLSLTANPRNFESFYGGLQVDPLLVPLVQYIKYFGGSSIDRNIIVEEVDGSPSYSLTTKLQFDQADGFTLSQPAAGTVRVDLTVANTIIARESDLAPSITATTVEVDSASYLVGTDQGGGVFRISISIPDASTSVKGLVNTSAQSFSGFKGFVGSINVGNSTSLIGYLNFYSSGLGANSYISCIAGPSNRDVITINAGTHQSGTGDLALSFTVDNYSNQFVFDGSGTGQTYPPTILIRDTAGSYATGQTGNFSGLDFVSGLLVGGSFTGGNVDGGSF